MKSIKILLTIILIWVVCAGCEELPEDAFTKTFVIRKGQHYASQRLIQTLQRNTLKFTARFDASATYAIGSDEVQSNTNKLLGFSDCNSMHHENSARFGWRWYHGRLEVIAYCYVNGERIEKYVGSVSLNDKHSYQITILKQEYVFMLDGEQAVSVNRGTVCETGVYYLLWPYFGGSIPAPHDIKIDIELQY